MSVPNSIILKSVLCLHFFPLYVLFAVALPERLRVIVLPENQLGFAYLRLLSPPLISALPISFVFSSCFLDLP